VNDVKLHQFEGPLDLLLSLIQEQKLNITELALSEVTEQFLAYVKNLEDIDATALADYLSIAAKLLVIKSKAILPSLEVETLEEESGEDLAQRLILYQQFKESAKWLKARDAVRQQSFIRTLVFSERISFLPDNELTPGDLQSSANGILQILKELDNLPKAQIREAISIQDKIQELQMLLSGKIETSLNDLLKTAKNKPEVIITFLALLELTKQRLLSVDQEDLFTDITIKQYKPSQVFTEEITLES
jgi:segregation and condensation protein A